MIMSLIQRKSLKLFHPLLKRIVKLYLSKPRNYKYENIEVRVLPGVFHPGLFFSTKVFVEYLKTLEIKGKSVLELGAGSGLLSIYCAKQGALVTASDINEDALNAIDFNASKNDVKVKTILSDLFEKLSPSDFDLILINPPYYPREAKNMEEKAWFCGEEFQYFQRLFSQLSKMPHPNTTILMILSEDCDEERIFSYTQTHFRKKVLEKVVTGERNFIFQLLAKQ